MGKIQAATSLTITAMACLTILTLFFTALCAGVI